MKESVNAFFIKKNGNPYFVTEFFIKFVEETNEQELKLYSRNFKLSFFRFYLRICIF